MISDEECVSRPGSLLLDEVHLGDARDMGMLNSNSVALVATSPPYFAGKEYEASPGEGDVPATYDEYLDLLRDVFGECRRVLEPGGRIAVNVANLGRRPYRSLSGDVARILEDLGFLLRGEVVWWKGRAAGGSCAWGTFQRPTNPVLRDVTERIVIASKGRFDRAIAPRERHARGLPSITTISRDEFLEATTDLWEIPPESATRVGHPAPFPIEIPMRLINLYTFEDDLVLDPFMGSGSTAIAAIRSRRHFVGFENDPGYWRRAYERIDDERKLHSKISSRTTIEARISPLSLVESGNDLWNRALEEGRQARELAELLLIQSGFEQIRTNFKIKGLGMVIDMAALDERGGLWGFDVAGRFTAVPSGLRRSDQLWSFLGRAAAIHTHTSCKGGGALPYVLITTDLPKADSTGEKALDALKGPGRPIVDVIELLNLEDHRRLRAHSQSGF